MNTGERLCWGTNAHYFHSAGSTDRSHGLIGTEEIEIVLSAKNLMSVNSSDTDNSKEMRRRANLLKGASRRELKRGDLCVVISVLSLFEGNRRGCTLLDTREIKGVIYKCYNALKLSTS